MSENYKLYAAKMAELRVYHASTRPLHSQLLELLVFVKRCEAQWKQLRCKSEELAALYYVFNLGLRKQTAEKRAAIGSRAA